ncbi:MAG: hypothetical protein K2X47_15045 [Bdellovibrionales bacterium]|nr:hypothetical protein [Bdellovibrionales bacterium]
MKTTSVFTSFVILAVTLQTIAQPQDKKPKLPAPQAVVEEVKVPQCTIAKVISEGILVSTEGDKTQSRTVVEISNGIALTSKVLMVMNHGLIGDSKKAKIILESEFKGSSVNQSVDAKVIARDHHFDIGLLEIDSTSQISFVPCQLSTQKPSSLWNVLVKGFKDINTHLIEISLDANAFYDQRSKNLEVPGIIQALEFKIPGSALTLSGSPLLQGNEVIAVLNATNNNAAFAAYAADLAPVAKELLREAQRNARAGSQEIAAIDRNYVYDPVKGNFEFSGLIVRGEDQFEEPTAPAKSNETQQARQQKGEGTVHRASEGTVHRSIRSRMYGIPDFTNTPVSGGDGLGFVVARLNPNKVDELKRRHPEVVARLESSIENTVRIYKIGNSAVRNIFQLLQVLASSNVDYRITEVVTKFQATTAAQNPYAASTHDALKLMQKIADNMDIPSDLKLKATTELRALIASLSELDREARSSSSGGTINSNSEAKAKAIWSSIDEGRSRGILFQLIARRLLGSEELALRNSIRARIPFNDIF